MTTVIGWDVGGAHLKMAAVDARGRILAAGQWATPLWRGLDTLVAGLHIAREQFPFASPVRHAVTMTGELVDCFDDRTRGVKEIASCVQHVLNTNDILFFSGPHGFVRSDQCAGNSNWIASANWYATGCYIAEQLQDGLLIDIGSTTTDIIPFANGHLCTGVFSDHERLVAGQLCYSGVVRTPIMAIVNEVPWKNSQCPVMNEGFATLADVYRITGELPDAADLGETCDGAAKDRPSSRRRLGRMIGLDIAVDDVEMSAAVTMMARFIRAAHVDILRDSVASAISKYKVQESVTGKLVLVGAGCGRFLLPAIADAVQFSFMNIDDVMECPREIRSRAADCASAVSVAQLLRRVH